MKDQIAPYAVIPSIILRNDNISSNCKILYAYVSTLSNQKGYCYASNKYLSEICKCDVRTLKRWLAELRKIGAIDVQIIKKGSQVSERRVFIAEIANLSKSVCNENTDQHDGIQESPGGDPKITRGVILKSPGGDPDAPHNSIRDNTISNNRVSTLTSTNVGGQKKSDFMPRMKAVYIDWFKQQFSLTYPWAGKDDKALGQIIAKIKKSIQDKSGVKVAPPDDVQRGLEYFLAHIPKWYLDNNAQLTTLNSNYISIVQQIIDNHVKSSHNKRQDGLDLIDEILGE